MADLYRKSSLDKLSNPEQLDKMIKITSPMSWLALLSVLIIIVATVIWAFVGTLPTTKTVTGILTSADNSYALYSDVTGTLESYSKKMGDRVKKDDEVAKIKTADGKQHSIKAYEDGIIGVISANVDSFIVPGTEIIRYSPLTNQTQVALFYVPLSSAQTFDEDMSVQIYPTSIDSQKYGHMEGVIKHVDSYATNIASLSYVLGSGNQLAEQFAANGPIVALVCELKTDASSKNGFYWSNDKGKSLTVDMGTIISGKIVVEKCAPITKLIKNIKDGAEG